MMKPHPPKWADRFLAWYCRPDLLEEIQGDAHELFQRTSRINKRKASLLFVWNVLRFFRWKNIRRTRNQHINQLSTDMLKNYITVGWRNLVRKKAFSMINIFGLAIGLTSFLLIGSFIYDELNYDTYPTHYKQIYRVGLQLEQNGGIDVYPHVDVAVAAGMKNDYPEILETTRLTGGLVDHIKHDDVFVKEESMAFVDSNFLKVFTIPLLEGNENKALVEPNSIVISRSMAEKYFGDKPALGEALTFRRLGVLKITGIFDKIPDQSHFHYNAFISLSSAKFANGRQTWSNVGYFTYLLLNEHADPARLEAKFSSLIEKHVIPEIREDLGMNLADAQKTVETWKFYLLPLSKIHLYSNTKYEIEPNGDINNIYLFGALAVFILILACINFMNLSTAGSARRAMEIGIRKSLGSFKSQLVVQFLVESVILALIALASALTIALLLLPFFNELTGKHIDASFFLSPEVLMLLLALGVTVGIVAGSYPAIFLSSFQTLRVLKSSSPGAVGRNGLRSFLVVFQFAISTGLIIATIIAYQQLHFMQNLQMGYDREQLLVIENANALKGDQIAFKQKLEQDHRVVSVSNSSVPIGTASQFGGTEVAPKEYKTSIIHALMMAVDYDYVKTLGLQVIAGRNFSTEFPADSLGTTVIINETAMKDLGWNESDVIGSIIFRSAKVQYEVVGVVRDFHYTSAKEKIAPLLMVYRGFSPSMLVKVKTSEIHDLVADLGKHWASFHMDVPFTYYFLDDRFSHLYESEQITEQIFIVFMVIAVLIASLGLYGLSTYSAEQRVREIGIRKVLGSTVSQIVFLQSKEFLILVLAAIAIAAPVSWWAMNQWLQNFGYRVEVDGWVIVVAAIAAIVIAIVTVSFQAIRAATANPVKSLRAE
jgi:putative ABC transport system permease protein